MIINVGTVAPFGGGKAVIEGCTGAGVVLVLDPYICYITQ